MRIGSQIVAQLITVLMAAQMRGWIDLRGLGPLLKVIVDDGNGPAMRGVLAELSELIERIEKGDHVA